MAILKIARMGHPVLFQRADPVADPTAPEIRRLIADMIDTVEDADGAGLAAPQVHVPLRLFVFRVPAARAGVAEEEAARGWEVLVNPVVEPLGEAIEEGWEGCLSIPGLQAMVPRPARVAYRGLDAGGRPVAREAGGFHARVIQHETDHLDGVLYTMRLRDFTRFGFTPEISRAQAATEPDAGQETAR
jgi:peptide deformylase